MQSVSISTASNTDTTTYGTLDVGKCSDGVGAPQLCRIAVLATASGTPASTGTLRFVLTDGTSVYKVVDAALSALTVQCRGAAAGSSGGYHLAVAFGNGTDYLDLAMDEQIGNPALSWKVGVCDAFMTNVTALTVYYKATSRI